MLTHLVRTEGTDVSIGLAPSIILTPHLLQNSRCRCVYSSELPKYEANVIFAQPPLSTLVIPSNHLVSFDQNIPRKNP
jgi:hypothetical protein